MSEQAACEGVNARDVIAFLREHPDFFQQHESLLEIMQIPHAEASGSTSLIERQVGMLREQKHELEQRIQTLNRSADSNERLLKRIEALVLELFDCDGLEAILQRLEDSLHESFHTDAAAIRLLKAPTELSQALAPNDVDYPLLQSLVKDKRPHCGYLKPEVKAFLFPQQVDEIASGVLIPLCEPDKECLGLMAIGSVDPLRYTADMGTVFVNHLGVITAHLLARHL